MEAVAVARRAWSQSVQPILSRSTWPRSWEFWVIWASLPLGHRTAQDGDGHRGGRAVENFGQITLRNNGEVIK